MPNMNTTKMKMPEQAPDIRNTHFKGYDIIVF